MLLSSEPYTLSHVPKVSEWPESTTSAEADINVLCQNPPPQSTPSVLDSARIATELLVDANVSHDVIF